MSQPKRRPLGREDYVSFVQSRPKLGVAVAAGVVCLLIGLIIGITSDSPGAELWGGSLLILGVVLLIDVGVSFHQWDRARPAPEADVSGPTADTERSGTRPEE
jgi:hypothetical protein